MLRRPRLHTLLHPYKHLQEVTGGKTELRSAARTPGSALIWDMATGPHDLTSELVAGRPGGLALIVVLPPTAIIDDDPAVLQSLHRCRPVGFLPHHGVPEAHDLAQVLRSPPLDLPADVTDYLTWRGLVVDRDTVRLLRRILELSDELRSVTSLARGIYMSRRALGRRLSSRGLPAPSHWLQLGRMLRLASRLQNSEASIFSVSCESGYPDGFSVSNQMDRLIGYRPSQVREHFGWEWILEAWLRREADAGGLAPATARLISKDVDSSSPRFSSLSPARPARSRSRRVT